MDNTTPQGNLPPPKYMPPLEGKAIDYANLPKLPIIREYPDFQPEEENWKMEFIGGGIFTVRLLKFPPDLTGNRKYAVASTTIEGNCPGEACIAASYLFYEYIAGLVKEQGYTVEVLSFMKDFNIATLGPDMGKKAAALMDRKRSGVTQIYRVHDSINTRTDSIVFQATALEKLAILRDQSKGSEDLVKPLPLPQTIETILSNALVSGPEELEKLKANPDAQDIMKMATGLIRAVVPDFAIDQSETIKKNPEQ